MSSNASPIAIDLGRFVNNNTSAQTGTQQQQKTNRGKTHIYVYIYTYNTISDNKIKTGPIIAQFYRTQQNDEVRPEGIQQN